MWPVNNGAVRTPGARLATAARWRQGWQPAPIRGPDHHPTHLHVLQGVDAHGRRLACCSAAPRVSCNSGRVRAFSVAWQHSSRLLWLWYAGAGTSGPCTTTIATIRRHFVTLTAFKWVAAGARLFVKCPLPLLTPLRAWWHECGQQFLHWARRASNPPSRPVEPTHPGEQTHPVVILAMATPELPSISHP